jgi:hypothetical protein
MRHEVLPLNATSSFAVKCDTRFCRTEARRYAGASALVSFSHTRTYHASTDPLACPSSHRAAPSPRRDRRVHCAGPRPDAPHGPPSAAPLARPHRRGTCPGLSLGPPAAHGGGATTLRAGSGPPPGAPGVGGRIDPRVPEPAAPAGAAARRAHPAALVAAGGFGAGPQGASPGQQPGPCGSAARGLADRCQGTRPPAVGPACQLATHRR